ncbi:WXG100-like domain-containing protein [Glycomyces albidus]|jgi:hypothetical protein|uniref:Outer membrane channel protein CpnT-like N-terminal domain-containing protein n=1 Tax=Glycomyces albidus TaxID=2656774 RepID=A0A6L5GGN4_9ACTN|nr:hypothetical protein [Glycomyces albidus]MQM28904.1 hypothetical protein [Glycomyces albidus]
MALMIPSELATLLSVIGHEWPSSNEDALMQSGQAWCDLSGKLTDIESQATTSAAQAWADQIGKDIDAFKAWWESEDGPADSLTQGATGAMIGGSGLMVCSALVLALKIMIIVQLAILAVQIALAIAQAAFTFGASLAQVPIFQQITRRIVDTIVDQVISQLLAKI